MPRINPWDQQFRRPAPSRRALKFTAPDWSLTLREPDEGDKGLVRDKQLEYVGRYVTGDGNPDGLPVKLTTPEMPPRVVKASRDLFNYVAAVEVLAEPAEGEEPLSLLEIVGWSENLPRQWEQIRAALIELYAGKPEAADPNPTGETPTIGKTSASP